MSLKTIADVSATPATFNRQSKAFPASHWGTGRRVPRSFRVLALDQSGELDTAEQSLLEFATHQKHSIEVALFDDGPFRLALEEAGVEVDVLDAPTLYGVMGLQQAPKSHSLSGLFSLLCDVVERARRVDVIYANTPRTMLVAVLAGMVVRRPVVWHLRLGTRADPLGRLQCVALKWCARMGLDRAIADSAASKAAFEAFVKVRRLPVDVVDEKPLMQHRAEAKRNSAAAPRGQIESVSAILAQAALGGAR